MTSVHIAIQEEPVSVLPAYARVPIAYTVREELAVVVVERGLGGLHLVPRPVRAPYVKDYDADPACHPTAWCARFDVSRWGILTAWASGARVGGAVIAWDSPDVDLLEGRRDLALLWDLRVAPAVRGQGIGTTLFRDAERWMAARGVSLLKVETQNVNVVACRFYARQGCILGALHRFAYPRLPDEVQLLWYKQLDTVPSRSTRRTTSATPRAPPIA
jgi:ribosomal protein S18 acetylase RimI-like enzyme